MVNVTDTSKILQSFLDFNIDQLLEKLNRLIGRIPDEDIKMDKQGLLNSIESNFSSLELFSLETLPRLKTIKKYFELVHKILHKSEKLNEDDKKDLEALIDEICKHSEKIMGYKIEQKKLQDYHLELEKLKLKIAEASQLKWYHKPNQVAALCGIFGAGVGAAGAGAGCYYVSHAGCLGAACCITPVGVAIAIGVGIVACIIIGAVGYYYGKQKGKQKEEDNQELSLIGKDLDNLRKLLHDYEENLKKIIAQQSNIECNVDQLKACLTRDILHEAHKEDTKEWISILDKQINSINNLLELLKNERCLSESFQNNTKLKN